MWYFRLIFFVGFLQLVLSSPYPVDDDSETWYTFAESEITNKKCAYYKTSDGYTAFQHYLIDTNTNEELILKGKIESLNGGKIVNMIYQEPDVYTLEFNIVFVNDDFEISYYTSGTRNYYFIYTKERKPPLELIEQIYNRLKENNIPRSIFTPINQDDCPW